MAEIPERVQEAKELIARQRRHMGVMLAGVFVAMSSMLMFGVADAKNMAVAAMVTMLAWLFGNLVFMGRRELEVASAQKVIDAYQHQDLMRELEAVEQGPPVPDDPRWEAVQKLIDRIRTLGATDELKITANQAETRLRHLLLDIATLVEAQRADAALGGQPESARQQRLDQARARKESAADALIESVRDLHVALAVQDSGDADPLLHQLQALLHQTEADNEVDQLDEAEAKRRLALAQRAQRQ